MKRSIARFSLFVTKMVAKLHTPSGAPKGGSRRVTGNKVAGSKVADCNRSILWTVNGSCRVLQVAL
jgi:hypothetical protein